jgi:cysteine desulfurase
MLVSSKTMGKQRIYFDNAATTRLDDRVLQVMLPYFSEYYGNASSLHQYGTEAKEVLEISRNKIAESIEASKDEVFFTSGGTESNNWALKGVAWANRHKGNHIIVSSIEHDCILNTCKWLEMNGFEITYLPVDQFGFIDKEFLISSITPQTILVSVMHANNEIGTIEPVDEIGRICRKQGVLFHSDACQSFGKIPVNVNSTNFDLLTFNAHKIYGPKGIGALYIRNEVKISPLLHGGGQEAGLRSTTENIPGIVGFAKAVELCMCEMEEESTRLSALRDELVNFLQNSYDGVYINGHPEKRLPGHLSFSFQGLEGETIRLLLMLDEMGISVSAGSACSSNDKTSNASHVLQAIGLNPLEARGAIRVSFGRFTTVGDMEKFIFSLGEVVKSLNPIFAMNTY